MKSSHPSILLEEIKTQRLTLQPWASHSAGPMHFDQLLEDVTTLLTPPVIQHLPISIRNADDSHISKWIGETISSKLVYCVYRRSEKCLVGLLILAPGRVAAETRDFHLSCLIAEHMWGQGLATELMRAFVADCALRERRRLLAGVNSKNLASARVLQKSGFKVANEFSTACTDVYVNIVGRLSFKNSNRLPNCTEHQEQRC